MAFAQQLYQAVFRRTSTLVFTVMVGAVIFERGFNQATEAIFCRLNEGVSQTRGLSVSNPNWFNWLSLSHTRTHKIHGDVAYVHVRNGIGFPKSLSRGLD
uniref:Cytochrome b-c1 complex subunit 9 n=1 Tax=Naja naja TaxID=35670 RepID=A0A8C6YE34_NAJNA